LTISAPRTNRRGPSARPVPATGRAELTGNRGPHPYTRWLVGYATFDATTDTNHVMHWNETTLTPDDTVRTAVPVLENHGQLDSALAATAPDQARGLWVVRRTRRADNTMPSALRRT
jgi:hypothetical protein